MYPRTIEYKALLLLVFLVIVSAVPYAPSTSELPQVQKTVSKQPVTKTKKIKYDHTLYGKASWYGIPFHGRLTANGETYNMHVLTAAHKSLPFDTMVKVTNLINGESVVVRINDRGPYIRGRHIDMSYSAAKHLNMVGNGVIPVKLEIMRDKSKFVYRGPKVARR